MHFIRYKLQNSDKNTRIPKKMQNPPLNSQVYVNGNLPWSIG